MQKILPLLVLSWISVLFFGSCEPVSNHSKTDARSFDPMSNFPDTDTVCLDFDMVNVVNNGLVLPSERQCEEASFVFKFKGEKGKFYKIFYQNDSYGFSNDDSLSCENFYGSWEDVAIGFKPIENAGVVVDSFRIVGNPRNEKKFYGADVAKNSYSQEAIDGIVEAIRNTPEWYAGIVEKAKKNNCTVERQLYLDAAWVIADRRNVGECNNRWKRNPRVGCYSFLLVVCDEAALDALPDYIQHIDKTDDQGGFVNPIAFFLTRELSGVQVIPSSRILKTRAVITPKQGVFINELNAHTDNYGIDSTKLLGNSDNLYGNALFEQFLSHVSKQFTLRNIPVIQDVVGGERPYTRAEYEANKTRFDSAELLNDYPVVSNCFGRTVKVDDGGESIKLINPGNHDPNDLRKESTGIRTRVGFTYGKFRGKIKFPVMLNEENIWNGLTYAFWLIYQDGHSWNNRRTSTVGGGYIDKGDDSPNPVRKPDNSYSEIDIEIVKASRYWPSQYYKGSDKNSKVEDGTQSGDVMFCCTNWDLAAPEPVKFSEGITRIPYRESTFEAMRWSKLYKALTTKEAMSNAVFKEPYYYYEIEWRPKEIIWRLGASPERMKVMGYMNDMYTSIPNNQMLCIVTQEYHYSEWWPPVVFWQGLIPYNLSDIEGGVFEIVVE